MQITDSIIALVEQCTARKQFALSVATTEAAVNRCISFREQQFFGEQQAASDTELRDKQALHVTINDTRTHTVIGYVRLISNAFFDTANTQVDFYSSAFYPLSDFQTHFPRGLEISRFCIEENYRRQPAIFLLIRQLITTLVTSLDIDALFGLASFEQASPTKHTTTLQQLHKPTAPNAATRQNLAPQSTHKHAFAITPSATSYGSQSPANLPPLLRFYLNFHPHFSQTAVLDHTFNSTLIFLYVTSDRLLNK